MGYFGHWSRSSGHTGRVRGRGGGKASVLNTDRCQANVNQWCLLTLTLTLTLIGAGIVVYVRPT